MPTLLGLLVMLLVASCGPMPTPTSDDDAALERAMFEHRIGECAVQFDPSSWITVGDHLTVAGRVRCDARPVTDRVALESTDGAFLVNDVCRVPERPAIVLPGNGPADGTRFSLVLGGGTGVHSAELVLRNTRVEGGVVVPADELRRFVLVYVTGASAAARTRSRCVRCSSTHSMAGQRRGTSVT